MRPERQQIIHSLFNEYIEMYASRDDSLMTRFSENFTGYAGSSDVLVKDRDEWIRVTRLDFSQVPNRIRIEMLDLAMQDLSDDIVAVTAFFHIHLPIPDHILSQETARLLLVFRLEGEKWMIAHSGISVPYGLARDGEIYPMHRLQQRNLELEALIEERTRALEKANRKLETLSNTDGLTGIANRRGFDHMLALEWGRGQRAGTPLALIMIDVDLFKDFNDHYGHVAGDACLQALAKVLAQAGRRAGGNDGPLRWRGIRHADAEFRRGWGAGSRTAHPARDLVAGTATLRNASWHRHRQPWCDQYGSFKATHR